jgi:pyridoxamine 5'-phosphate oxidase
MTDPIARFIRWFREAKTHEIAAPEACALATVGSRSRPSVRYVLLKRVDRQGFVFFTDVRSRKGREIAAHSNVALVFYWSALGRQVRVEGRTRELSSPESDAYWRTRPRGSQISASASRQSAALDSRAALVRRVRQLRARYRGRPIPRPEWWKGILVRPRAMEFWIRQPYRLHLRVRYARTPRGWASRLLQP